MNREQIIEMAEQAGIVVIGEAVWHLCELVAQAEREACAKVAESMRPHGGRMFDEAQSAFFHAWKVYGKCRRHPRKGASVNRELLQQWATTVWGPLGDVVNADAWLNNLEKFAQLAIADAELEAYQLGYQAGLHRSKQ